MINLNNDGPDTSNTYYPRLMINERGEILLATHRSKKYGLTTGILVAKTEECTTKWPIGTKWTDWEVGGALRDYNGEVTITVQNKRVKIK